MAPPPRRCSSAPADPARNQPRRRLTRIAKVRARVERLFEWAQGTLPARVLSAYGESQAGNYALALAFTGFMSMFPLILGVLAVIGLLIRNPETELRIQTWVIDFFPASAQTELQHALQGVKASAGWLGVISLVGLLWGGSSILSTLEFALTRVFGTRQRNILRQRSMGLVMIILFVVAIVATVTVDSIVSFVPYIGPFLSFLFGSAVIVSLLVALYRFVPNRKFRLREVILGALIAGVLIQILSFAFPIYARIAGSFNTYGAQFGLFFLLATWFYLLSQLILLGAVITKFQLGEDAPTGVVEAPVNEPKGALTESPPPPTRSIFQRLALGVAVAVAVAAGFVRRRRTRSAT